ncbi:fucosyl transferase [Ancylostoma caninum]|uniref:Fucosyltransferase n=1 Tax=Ancylostoma caninum TaxID=29170 RepID=A0A368H2Q2_ANCCA|nr:fucosyl transferase [Ancylostoma caninum]
MRCSERTSFLTVFALCILLYLQLRRDPVKQPKNSLKNRRNPEKHVVIYAATKFFGMDVTTERFLSKCHSTVGFCRISENPADIDKADAILFHNADYSPMAVPKPRKLSRPHVLWSLESPTNDHFRPEQDVINWTMTFRRDADIWYPYGHFQRSKTNSDPFFYTSTHSLEKCNHSMCSVELPVRIIKSVFSIDRYGRCGKPAPGCDGVNKQGHSCVAQLIRPYKFYISIENSNCVDYVTEKFYESLISRMAVPIVLKRRTYLDIGAPPNSFLAIDDFATIFDMVKFVNEAAADKEKYLQFHRWRLTHEWVCMLSRDGAKMERNGVASKMGHCSLTTENIIESKCSGILFFGGKL